MKCLEPEIHVRVFKMVLLPNMGEHPLNKRLL